MKTTLSAALALAAFAGSTLAQAGGPLWDRRLEATDVQLICDSSGQTFVQVTPFVSNFSSSTIDIGTIAEVFVNGAPVTAELGAAVLPPTSTVGTCVDLICYWPCIGQGTQCRFFPYNGRCTCFIPTERVLPPVPVTIRDGDVVTVQLSAAPGAVPEVYPDGDSVSFVARFPSGILHTPIGTATLGTAVDRRLPVTNLGSSGQDGVEVKFRTAVGGTVDIDMSHHFGPSNVGRSLRTRYKGWDGTIKGRYTATATFSDGVTQDVSEECDFSPLGSVGVEVVCIQDDGTPVQVSASISSTLSLVSHCPIDPVSPPSWRMGAGRATFSDLSFMVTRRTSSPATIDIPNSTGGVTTVPNVVEVQFRPICIVAPCPGDWTNLGSMMVMTDTPQLDVSNAQIKVEPCAGCPNGPTDEAGIYATGSSTIAEVQTDMSGDGVPDLAYRGRGIGSSGNDGVEVSWPPATASVSGNCCRGHVIIMKLYDDDAGAEARVGISNDPATGDMTLEPDFTAMGATSTLLTAYDDAGNPVDSRVLTAGAVAVLDYSTICPPGSHPTFVTFGNKTYFTGCQWIFDLVVPGQAGIPNVHTISIEPVGATSSFSHIQRTAWLGNDVEVGNFAFSAPTGPTCDSTDFNQDGLFPDTLDIDDFLSVFSGGMCSDGTMCNTDTDFNNDGLFPDTMDIDSLLSVFSGGPCI